MLFSMHFVEWDFVKLLGFFYIFLLLFAYIIPDMHCK